MIGTSNAKPGGLFWTGPEVICHNDLSRWTGETRTGQPQISSGGCAFFWRHTDRDR